MEDFLRFEGQNEIDFLQRFSDRDSCYAYLAHYKWKDGFEFERPQVGLNGDISYVINELEVKLNPNGIVLWNTYFGGVGEEITLSDMVI